MKDEEWKMENERGFDDEQTDRHLWIQSLFRDWKYLSYIHDILHFWQDVLENCFSSIRGYGGQGSHPTSAEFCRRMRVWCLNGHVESLVPANAPVELAEEEETIMPLPELIGGDEPVETEEIDQDKCLLGNVSVASWLAVKLGLPTTEPAPGSYIAKRSRGKLRQATLETVEMTKVCSVQFNRLHGKNKLKNGNEMLLRTQQFIWKHVRDMPGITRKFVNLFSKVKFFHRLKSVNNFIRESSKTESVRSLKQFAQHQNWVGLCYPSHPLQWGVFMLSSFTNS